MVLENPIIFHEWIGPALAVWLAIVGAFALLALVVSFLLTTVTYGPARAGDKIYSVLVSSASDMLHLSPRRIWALARLAMQEAMRRQVLTVLAVFLVILLFASWFLDPESVDPSGLYISVLMTAITYLTLLVGLVLSVFSLPTDIKNHTIYTVVTKPVRPGEIVLGRIVGFTIVGTVMLAIMSVLSYFFIVRSLQHTHTLPANKLSAVAIAGGQGDSPGILEGQTSTNQGHFHRLTVRPGVENVTEVKNGHWHSITTTQDADGKASYTVGPPQGQFNAKVPVYGKLKFRDEVGDIKASGISVGKEWTYRSYIIGGSEFSAGIWTFSGLKKEDFPNGLPLEMTLRVYRTLKGDIEHGIPGSFVFRNPRNPNIESAERIFLAKEFETDKHLIPLTLDNRSRTGKLDLFEDLVEDGALEVELRCLDHGQYFGMAMPDLYLLSRNASFTANFFKGFVSIWLQMLLLISVGVMWSTFLNGPVAMLATMATFVGGYSLDFIRDLATGQQIGGATFQSMIRIVTHKGQVNELEQTTGTAIATAADTGIQWILSGISLLLPNFAELSDAQYVATGFNIPGDLLLAHLLYAIGYGLPVAIIGFFCLKLREVAK